MKRLLLQILLIITCVYITNAQSKLKPRLNHDKTGKVIGTPAEPAQYKFVNVKAPAYLDFEPEFKTIKHVPYLNADKLGLKVTLWSDSGLPVWIEGKLKEGKLVPGTPEEMAKQYLSTMSKVMQIRDAVNEF